jgi:hypothetical protein
VARLTSDFFVSHLIRRINNAGGFAAVARRGAAEAGAIYIVMRNRLGEISLYGPASQQSYDATHSDRLFQRLETVVDDESLDKFTIKEARFDPDFWMIDLEPAKENDMLPFEITTP